MKRIIFTIVLFASCIAVFANPDKDKKDIIKAIKTDITKAYDIKSEPIHYSTELQLGYVYIHGNSVWSHLPEYATADISTVMSKYANIQRISDWSADKNGVCTYSEYQCFLDTDRIYTIILTFYAESNVLSVCVFD